MKILLAEDDFINRLTVERMLEKKGHTVVPASNGRDAIRALSDRTIELVLMDISMPEMDGIEAAECIRGGKSEAADPAVPIIAMTAHALPEDRVAYREAGMDGFVEKPVDMEELLETVASVSAAPATDHDPAEKPARPSAPSITAGSEDAEILDRPWLLERYEGDEELVAEVYQIFTEDAPLRLADLHKALEENNDTGAVKAAHALKGMSATIGARAVSEIASEIEILGRRGLMDDFRKNVGRLVSAVDEVIQRIQA